MKSQRQGKGFKGRSSARLRKGDVASDKDLPNLDEGNEIYDSLSLIFTNSPLMVWFSPSRGPTKTA